MNFGSPYVYVNNYSSEESISDESDNDVTAASVRPPSKAVRKPAPKKKTGGLGSSLCRMFSGIIRSQSASQASADDLLDATDSAHAAPKKKTKRVRKADSNVFTINIGNLVSPVDVQKGPKYIKCSRCSAVMTGHSNLQVDNIGDKNLWKCEFCETESYNMDTAGWEKPASNDITYLLEQASRDDLGKMQRDENHNIIFVIDISGSMGTTKKVVHVGVGGDISRTFVSRLDAIKTAADHQIRALKEESPNVRVGLVAFGTDIVVYGDGSSDSVTYNNVGACDQQTLYQYGHQQSNLRPVYEAYDRLTQKLDSLDIDGKTALGPGLLIATAMASKCKGSKVVICTDGCANVGFGTLPRLNADEDGIISCRDQYRSIGEYARDCGVTISVISLTGTDCRLVHLGMVAQITGGAVDIVDQSNLTNQFGNILSDRTVATDVTVTLCLYHNLYIRDPDVSKQKSVTVRKFGNVTSSTDMVVEFGVRRPANENEQPIPMEVEDQQGAAAVVRNSSLQPDQLPFQTQVLFTTRDGDKYLRVVTCLREKTTDRSVAEAGLNIDVVGVAASKLVSDVALTGNYKGAKVNLKSHKKMAMRSKDSRSVDTPDPDEDESYGMYENELKDLDNLLQSQSSALRHIPIKNAALSPAQNMMADNLAQQYMARASFSSASYAQKKIAKRLEKNLTC